MLFEFTFLSFRFFLSLSIAFSLAPPLPRSFSENNIDLKLFCVQREYFTYTTRIHLSISHASPLRFFHPFGQGKAHAYDKKKTYTHTTTITTSNPIKHTDRHTHTNMEQQGKSVCPCYITVSVMLQNCRRRRFITLDELYCRVVYSLCSVSLCATKMSIDFALEKKSIERTRMLYPKFI